MRFHTDANQYHVKELEVALDPNNRLRAVPELKGHGRVLDVGCGAGQTLIAANLDTVSFGVDVDTDALHLGSQWTDRVRFAAAQGEYLPFADASFDFVMLRGTLLYMDIPAALREVRRVTKPNGEVWMMLHDLSAAVSRRIRQGTAKERLYAAYVAVNGMFLHVSGRTFRSPDGRCESFQTERGMRIALERVGFTDVEFKHDHHLIVTAKAGPVNGQART
jgi:ubiquinone/menaquinone biosynthesis C-methylase UbiE